MPLVAFVVKLPGCIATNVLIRRTYGAPVRWMQLLQNRCKTFRVAAVRYDAVEGPVLGGVPTVGL
jgi:hypothetical protein